MISPKHNYKVVESVTHPPSTHSPLREDTCAHHVPCCPLPLSSPLPVKCHLREEAGTFIHMGCKKLL